MLLTQVNRFYKDVILVIKTFIIEQGMKYIHKEGLEKSCKEMY